VSVDLAQVTRAIVQRRLAGVALAGAVICLGVPEWLIPAARWLSGVSGLDVRPWLEQLRAWSLSFSNLQPWPLLPALISVGLLLASWLIPPAERTRRRIAPVVRDETAMAVGVLLLCEPLMHLGFLWWSGSHPSAVSRDAVFPIPMLGGLATMPWWAGITTILTISVLVPVAEELFFRGRLLDVLRYWFRTSRWATVWAVSLTTLAFAAAHGTQVQALFAIPLGLLLALIRLRSGSIGGCILAHACHNSMFLYLGPMLFAKPWVAPLLALSGVMLIAAAWVDHPATSNRPRVPNRWRAPVAITAVLLALLVIRLTASTFHHLQDRLWAGAAHQIITQWRVDNDVLLHRLDYQAIRGRLNDQRREGVFNALVEKPCQAFTDGNPRQAQVLAQLLPEKFATMVSDEQIYDRLFDFSDCQAAWPNIALAAQLLSIRRPDELAAVATAVPTVLVQWFNITTELEKTVAQLRLSQGPTRRLFLSACERAFPGRVTVLLFAIPADEVTAIDRRHLFMNYPDARERLRILSETDPARAGAFLAE
jgi:membrane protease YdiL (CAAX protease family)